MANQKARIGMMMAIAMIIAMTTNKPNASSMYPDSQPNPSISASAAHTEYASPSLGHEASIDSAKPLSSYIDNSTSNLQRFDIQILD